ncbi:hypothetical protein BFJ68_g16526, partial [Fusarium oxysporum]
LVAGGLDSCIGLALELIPIFLLDLVQKLGPALQLVPFFCLLLLWPPRPRLLLYATVTADLEPSLTVPPMAHLLALHTGPPRARLTCLLGSVSDVSTLLPIIYPTVPNAAMFLHPAHLPDHIWTFVAT